jgi:hypothetical protein
VTDALSLDLETVASQVAGRAAVDPWLERRMLGWGASEIPALLLAYDRRPDEVATARRYHLDAAAVGRWGVPRIVAQKAGLAARGRQTRTMSIGQELERELVETWAKTCGYDRVTHADAAPRESMPWTDRECWALTATPDAWCRGPSGELIAVEAKCTTDYPQQLAWYWRAQLLAQLAVMSAAAGALVCGPGWIFSSKITASQRAAPISWLVERDEAEIARIRDVARFGWAVVQSLKERQ